MSIMLALLVFICIGPAAAAVESADRSINNTEVAPGGTVVVTTTAEFQPRTDDARIEETISPALPAENIAITDTTGATISAYQESSGTIFASWGNVSSVTIQYKITLPADAPGGTTFNFSASQVADSADGDTATIAGDQVISVPASYANDGQTAAPNTSDSTANTTNTTGESGDGTTDGTPGFDIGVAVGALVLSGFFLNRHSSYR
jgi:hypothetical protein